MRIAVSLVLAAGLLVAAAAAQDQSGGALDRLQGTWKVVELTEGGRQASADKLKDSRMTVKGNAYRFVGGTDYHGTLSLDPSQTPNAMTATFVDDSGAEQGKAYGIYELKGDTLKLCWRDKSKERPTAFESPKDSSIRLVVLKREKE